MSLSQGWIPTKYDPIKQIPNQLNAGLESADICSEFTATAVRNGFANSGLRAIHDGPRAKIFVSALHVPDQKDGTSHHFKLDIAKFTRPNKDTPWKREAFQTIDNKETIDRLMTFLREQASLAGVKIEDNKQYQAIALDNKLSITIEKVQTFVADALSGEKAVVEKEILKTLKQQRKSKEQIQHYEDDLAEYKRLVAESETTETDMQNYLSTRVWFFGLDYIQSHLRSKPKFSTGLGSEYDFLLEGFNQVYDIAELKGPNAKLIDEAKVSERKSAFDPRVDYKYSRHFGRALHQVVSYMDEFEENFGKIEENQPSIQSFNYPSAIIVISKRSLFPETGKDSKKYLHLLNRQLANIDVLTYDDLADRAENIINFMKEES